MTKVRNRWSLKSEYEREGMMGGSNHDDGEGDASVAMIGLAGRFPGARDAEQFWENLKRGVESISFFRDEELELWEESQSILAQPNFVKAKGLLDDVESFDAVFFGFNPREAELLDPQHRVFLECAWHALENAGYNSATYSGRIGVYGGTSTNTYLLNIYSNRSLLESIDPFQLLISSDKDFLTSRVSYKLGLSGPSITVQTACSTSLVAVHLACQSLLNGECDIALAGGVSITLPQKSGYVYHEGSFLSPDGHCRAFDAEAMGTVSGNGAGIVVLKRLAEAIADRDYIYAVIRGSAVNNDAAMKAGYTAPSVTAQATVIAEALAVGGVGPDSISYVETHGTGTTLGDPVEIAALTKAFRIGTQKTGYCAIGSVKTNIGHLDAAAGAASLIKVAMALSERRLPASLHFKRPNPQLNLDTSPFYVNTNLTTWESAEGPRRAGVSSFGIGGTNAHVVLEEAPPAERSGPSRPHHLLMLSARTIPALDRLACDLADYLRRQPDIDPADAAYTLQLGRRHFENRRFLVCRDAADATDALTQNDRSRVFNSSRVMDSPPVVLMFPGQGSQHVNMGQDLYLNEPKFREEADRCSDFLAPLLGLDLRDVIFPENVGAESAAERLHQTAVAQAALFTVEYATAQLLMDWGLSPWAMIGHSIGEYVAACIAGVFSLEDALKIVSARGRLMQEMPPGGMIAVSLGVEDALEIAGDRLSVAAINGSSLVVLSGTLGDVEELESKLTFQGINFSRLHTSHAFHSEMMEPVLKPFEEQVRAVKLNPPNIRYISNVTGNWTTAELATDPAYWARHMRETVRFSTGLETLLKKREGVFIEVGPGRTLATFARARVGAANSWPVINTLRPLISVRSDHESLLEAVGRLWLSGANLDWTRFYGGERRRRIPLPGYPFEGKRYWIDFQPPQIKASQNGSVSERVLHPSLHERPASLDSEYATPTNETEGTLAEIWQGVFGIESVGVNDEFFALGGHSLLATQLIAEIREAFEIELPLQKFFEAPTIAGLAIAVEDALIRKIDTLSEEDVQKLLG